MLTGLIVVSGDPRVTVRIDNDRLIASPLTIKLLKINKLSSYTVYSMLDLTPVQKAHEKPKKRNTSKSIEM